MRKQLLWLLLCAPAYLFFTQTFHDVMNPNESSRLLLTSAIVDDHALSIDQAIARYGDTVDKSIYKGRTYCAKAIGSSLVLIPFYFTVTRIFPGQSAEMIVWALRIFLNFIPLALFSFGFYRFLKNDSGDRACIPIAALLFGTLFWPFSQVLFSHVLVGMLWFVSFILITQNRNAFFAGALMGLTFLMEIPSAVTIALFAIWIFIFRKTLFLHFVAGALILSVPAFVYNAVAFDGWLNWPYKYVISKHQHTHSAGYVGIQLPSLRILYELTIGSSRGFFYLMPHLLFGLWGLLRERNRRQECLLAGGIVAANFLFYSGYGDWSGGWSFGPRFLIPVIPFLIYGCALWMNQIRENHPIALAVYLALLAISCVNMLFGVSIYPYSLRISDFLQHQYYILYWHSLLGPATTAWNVREIALVLLIVPLLLLTYYSRLKRAHFIVFATSLALYILITGLIAPKMERGLNAQHSFCLGQITMVQGHSDAAKHYLELSLSLNPPAQIREVALVYLQKIQLEMQERR